MRKQILIVAALLPFAGSVKAGDPEMFWLIQRVSITTSVGVTGILPGTKVTVIKEDGVNLIVTDGTNTFQVARTQVTTDAALAQQAAANDYSAQVVIADAKEKEAAAARESRATEEKERMAAEQEKAKSEHEKAGPLYRLQGIVKWKLEGAILLERPRYRRRRSISSSLERIGGGMGAPFSSRTFPDDMHTASDKAAGIRYAEPSYLYLIGYPGAERLANDDSVDCVASEAGVRTVDGTAYHAYRFVSD